MAAAAERSDIGRSRTSLFGVYMNKIFLFFLAIFLLTSPCLAAEKSASELRLIAQAGGSLIVDLGGTAILFPS